MDASNCEYPGIDILNNQAWNVRVSDSNQARLLSIRALELAKKSDYPKGTAEALRTLGFTSIRISKHTEALEYLQEALHLFESLSDLRGQSDVYEYFGIIKRSLGDYKSSLEFLIRALDLRQQTNYQEGEALSFYHLGVTYRYLGNLDQALELLQKSLSISRKMGYWISESYSLNNIGSIYLELNDYENALKYYNESLATRKDSSDKWGEAGCFDNIGLIYSRTGDFTKALEYCGKSLEITRSVDDKKGQANALSHLAEINYLLKDYEQASQCAAESLDIRKQIGDKKGQAEIYLQLAEINLPSHDTPESIQEQLKYLDQAFALATETDAADLLYKIHNGFYKAHKKLLQYEKALEHFEFFSALEKQIHSDTISQKILNLEITYGVEKSIQEKEIYRLRNIELAAMFEETNSQKKEIELQKASLETTLEELKAAQALLIQSEKMASLGELTAGIAHEIQNPLNFVNNFSELNAELIEELKCERLKGDNGRNERLEEQLILDIAQNEKKINLHGKRADAIVKGMLQHSRLSTGQKEPTDINALTTEYLRLSYFGLHAREQSVTPAIKTDLDTSIQIINVVPQDVGKVLLNLFTNAFYAVIEKKKQLGNGFKPGIQVSTNHVNGKIEIRVKDNGNGIPQAAVGKIFQPFFTTKPTGQGTGLGLSLSYDIIKAHGGGISVKTKEGEFAEFIVELPIN